MWCVAGCRLQRAALARKEDGDQKPRLMGRMGERFTESRKDNDEGEWQVPRELFSDGIGLMGEEGEEAVGGGEAIRDDC